MSKLIVEAFIEAHDGYSADRVVADAALNNCFIEACRRRGLVKPASDLNLALLNLRKRAALPTGSRRTVVRNQDEYAFAAEIAIRSVERQHNTTLDRVLCDPALAIEFDSIAAMIAPGFTSLEYRWAALRLRKTNRLKPELLARVVPTSTFGPVAISDLDPSQLPNEQGVYVLTSREKVLYIGEAKSLRGRLKKHLDHSDNKQLARYIWEFGMADLMLEFHVLPPETRTDVRKAMELELIRSRRAEFNVQR